MKRVKDTKEYARCRKQEDMKGIDTVLKSKGEAWKHEDYREPLSVMETKVITILLSWGGDKDGYKLYYDNDGELDRGVYYWTDWGVYEEVVLTHEEAEKVEDYYQEALT